MQSGKPAVQKCCQSRECQSQDEKPWCVLPERYTRLLLVCLDSHCLKVTSQTPTRPSSTPPSLPQGKGTLACFSESHDESNRDFTMSLLSSSRLPLLTSLFLLHTTTPLPLTLSFLQQNACFTCRSPLKCKGESLHSRFVL